MQQEEQKNDLNFRDDPLIKKALEVFEKELADGIDTQVAPKSITPMPQFTHQEAALDTSPHPYSAPAANEADHPAGVEIEMTTNQCEQLIKSRLHWLVDVGCSTRPANRNAAEQSVREAYDAAGLRQPSELIWTASPAEACRLIGTLDLERPVWLDVLDTIRKRVVRQIAGRIGSGFFAQIEQDFFWPLLDNIRRIASPEANDLRRSHGCHGADSFGALDYCHRVLGIEDVGMMRGHIGAARAAGWWWPLSEACVITERPICLEHDMWGLHCADGPALAFPDGSEFYAWRGIAVPEKVIMQPERLKIREVLRMPTAPVRRCAIERYGMERFLKDSKAKIIHSDDFGTLYRKNFIDDEITVVKVVNATSESDGSFRDYFLQVPPDMKTAREAVAWTFGLESTDYAPGVES